MNKKSWIYKLFGNLPSAWIILTLVYLGMTFLTKKLYVSKILGYITGLLGMFVPIGVWNFVFSLEKKNKWIIVFPLVLLVVFGGEAYIRKFNLSPVKKVLVIFGILFTLTIGVDFIIYGMWQSLTLLLSGGKIGF